MTRTPDLTRTLAPGAPTRCELRFPTWEEAGPESVDYHMHTIHTDGKDSPQAMAAAARSTGIGEVLFSEHVRHSSTYYPDFVTEIKGIEIPGLSVKVGVETKVLNIDGHLDCSIEIAELTDGILGSVHSPPAIGDGTIASWSLLTPKEAVDLEFHLAMAIVTKSRAHVLAHPMGMVVTRFQLQPLDQLAELARACAEYGKAFELNTRYCSDPVAWTQIVREFDCKVSFGSDAHRAADVGSAWHLFYNRRDGRSKN